MHFINFNYGDLTARFECLDNKPTVEHVSNILRGETYKAVPGVPDVRTIVDIGANLGATSLLFSCWYPGAMIYSIEPQKELYDILVRNSARNPNARCFNFGLYNTEKRLPLYKSWVEPGTGSIGKSFLNTPNMEEIQLRDAATFLREQAIHEIDMLKVDTEGCEVPILESMRGWLRRIWVVFLEYHSEEDRRRIDELLSPTHVLLRAKVEKAHCGEVTYVRFDLGHHWPDLHLHRIVMPR